MAKLQTRSKTGFNAGDSYNVRFVRLNEIVIDPEIAKIFDSSYRIKNEISEKIKRDGYDKSQPLTVQKGTNILLDGHTRLAAAKDAGLEEIPVVEKEFEDRDEAVLYTLERQLVRRNLTGSEILTATQMIKNKIKRDGTGRSVDALADRLGISASTVYQAKAILRESPAEDVEAVKKGEMSIKRAYKNIKRHQKPETENSQTIKFFNNDSQGLPSNVSFLNAAVILLIEADQEAKPAAEFAELLINHFLKKNEKYGFYKSLPKNISSQLPRLPLVGKTANARPDEH